MGREPASAYDGAVLSASLLSSTSGGPDSVYKRLRREVLRMAIRDATMARGSVRRDAIAWLTSEAAGGPGLRAADLLSECGIDSSALRRALPELEVPARRSEFGPGQLRIGGERRSERTRRAARTRRGS